MKPGEVTGCSPASEGAPFACILASVLRAPSQLCFFARRPGPCCVSVFTAAKGSLDSRNRLNFTLRQVYLGVFSDGFKMASLPKRVTVFSTCLPWLGLEGSGRREMILLVMSDGVSASEDSGNALLAGPLSTFHVVG